MGNYYHKIGSQMTDTNTFEGRPIIGQIERDKLYAEQWDGTRFLRLLDAALNAPNVASVRWRQCVYGDTREFIVHEFYLKIPGNIYGNGAYGDGFVSYVDLPNIHPGAASLLALDRRASHFEVVLREKFGDHSIITATHDKFQVEYYEHD